MARPHLEQPPALVTVHVYGVRRRGVPGALARMAVDPVRMRAVPGAQFSKLLGTADGATFTPRGADPRHWAVLTAWPDQDSANAFDHSRVQRGWQRLSTERLRVSLRPLSAWGRWSRREPFGAPAPRRVDGPVASITRARIRPTKARAFYRAVPRVADDLASADGLRLAMGIGEAPVGVQGTFSLWDSTAAVVEFAHRRAAHAQVVARTHEEQWYAEELFARFEVLDVEGTYRGRRP